MKKLSFVIPLFNEAKRVGRGIEAIKKYMDRSPLPCETILVDDGSIDNTVALVNDQTRDDPRFTIISYPVNKGKGHAVKVGMLIADGDIRLFADIDMSVPIETADAFIAAMKDGHDIVIGTRKTSQSKVMVHQPKYREILGEIFRRTAQQVFAKGITDFTCGFKAFSAQATERIFTRSRINRWSFDAEILFLATRWGMDIFEIPVTWVDDPRTKVNLGTDAARSLLEMFAIRWYGLLGKYK